MNREFLSLHEGPLEITRIVSLNIQVFIKTFFLSLIPGFEANDCVCVGTEDIKERLSNDKHKPILKLGIRYTPYIVHITLHVSSSFPSFPSFPSIPSIPSFLSFPSFRFFTSSRFFQSFRFFPSFRFFQSFPSFPSVLFFLSCPSS